MSVQPSEKKLTDEQIAEHVRVCETALNNAINAALQAGLTVEVDTLVLRGVMGDHPRVSTKISRPL